VDRAREAWSIVLPLGSIEDGDALVRLVYARAIHAAGDVAGGRAAILAARDLLLARADKVTDPRLRSSFLSAVPENALTLELAMKW
jgi:hypothetical protein